MNACVCWAYFVRVDLAWIVIILYGMDKTRCRWWWRCHVLYLAVYVSSLNHVMKVKLRCWNVLLCIDNFRSVDNTCIGRYFQRSATNVNCGRWNRNWAEAWNSWHTAGRQLSFHSFGVFVVFLPVSIQCDPFMSCNCKYVTTWQALKYQVRRHAWFVVTLSNHVFEIPLPALTAVSWSLKIPPHLKYFAPLPCEILTTWQNTRWLTFNNVCWENLQTAACNTNNNMPRNPIKMW